MIALRARRAAQAVDRLTAGAEWQDSGLVFTTTIGTPVEPRNSTGAGTASASVPSCRACGFTTCGTFVTLFLDLGVKPHIIQAIAGHSGIEVTMTVYAHASQEEQRATLRGLGDRLG